MPEVNHKHYPSSIRPSSGWDSQPQKKPNFKWVLMCGFHSPPSHASVARYMVYATIVGTTGHTEVIRLSWLQLSERVRLLMEGVASAQTNYNSC